MSPRAALDLLALFMVSVYTTIPLFWLMMHPFMLRWRKRGRKSYWIILPIWACLLVLVFSELFHLRALRLYHSWIAWIPASLLLLGGFVIMRLASHNFSRAQISGLAELEPGRHRDELVVSGIRARIRHPIYLAHLCEILGWCIGSGMVAAYASLPLAFILGAYMIRTEERELESRFGESYRRYRNEVPAILPRISP